MENTKANIFSISRNKYNINLLETIEHKELFQNIKDNSTKINYKNYPENNNYIIKNNNNQSEKIHYDNTNIQKQILSNSKNSSKSYHNIMKNKLENMQEIFSKYSPNKNKRFLTQNNSGKINTNKKQKRNTSHSFQKRIIDNKVILEHNLTNFNFERINNYLNLDKNDYLHHSRNDNLKLNNSSHFNKSTKKEITNNQKFSFIYNNNNNLDVYNRLYNKSYYKKKKIENIISKEEKDCTFNPRLLSNFKEKKSNYEEINNFIKRQEKFNKYINQKKIDLKNNLFNNESKKYTFTPNTSCTSGSKYSIKLEAQRQDESKLDKTNRMVYEQIKKMNTKNNNLFLMYNNQFSFIPTINKKINIKKQEIFQNVPKFQKRNINTYKNDINTKDTQKYINHQYDNVKSNYKNDKELMARIKEENRKRKKRIDIMRKEQENSKFEGYTFKPDINKNNLSYMDNFYSNMNNLYYNKQFDRELSYTDNYNRKRNLQNNMKRSYSCYNKNNLYINSNVNYNNFNNSKEGIYYNNTDYENDKYYFNDYNNCNINYNNCDNSSNFENDFNKNESNYYNEYNYYKNDIDEYNKYDYQYNDIGQRSLNMGYNKNKRNYMFMTPKCNKIYKSHVINNIKREDQENFLLIHKLLYDK